MYKQLSYIIVGIILLVACSKEQDTPIISHIVVEGWIEDEGFPIVILTTSLPISYDNQNINNLDDHLIRWAKISISDGNDSVMLVGKYTHDYFPPYIYTTGRMRGKAGYIYTLTVDYQNYHATAVTTIPHRPTVDSFSVEKCLDSDTLYQISTYITDNPNEKNYYQIFTRVGTHTKQYNAAYLGSIDDETIRGSFKIPIYRGNMIMNKDYTPYFLIDDTVSIKVAQVDESSYRFWDEYTKSLSLSRNMFLSTSQNVKTNIKGGVGYWCGYGAINIHIPISDYIK
ncbi:MAG: DUF4249 domain-containing protein [Prevotella sp.]|nr:DUF4249 domain-containing protein [Prevotella sp.]